MARTSTLQLILTDYHKRIYLLLAFMAAFCLFHILVMPFQLSYYSAQDFIRVNLAYNVIALTSLGIGFIVIPKYLPTLYEKIISSVFNRIVFLISLLFCIAIGIFIFKIAFGYYEFILARVGTGLFAMTALSLPIGLVAYTIDTRADRTTIKEWSELAYWKIQKIKTKKLNNDHYEEFYTKTFGMNRTNYADKKVLDIGCGPRGSLEWVPDSTLAIGLDPLANEYLNLHSSSTQLKMQLVEGYCEDIPFDDNYFDIVTSFNSIDHVEDIQQSAKEIQRVIKPGGLLLLICDVNRKATITEPHSITTHLLADYFTKLNVVDQRLLLAGDKFRIYANIRANQTLENTEEQGVLIAKLTKF